MKKNIVFVFLLTAIKLFAQVNAVKPAITAMGKPEGEKVSMEIGKDGGSFTSSDGKVRLVFPAGALSKKTTISIQAVTNELPNGNSKAYQMEPSGIIFKQPVKLIFYYNNNETEGNAASLLGMAMQDEKGSWSSLNKAVTDTVLKTITADIRHFSSYANYRWAKIYPATARVKVNGSLRLNIRVLVPLDESDDDELSSLGGVEEETNEIWSVNAIPKGNSIVGFISASQNKSAIYQAPAIVPDQNPVAVTVEHQYTNQFVKRYGNLKLVSNITVYGDAWEVKMVSAMIGGSPAAWGGITTNRDEGSFIVSLEKNKPAIIDIKNQMEVMTDNCQKIILNPNSNTGIFHVVGSRQIKVTPANPPGQPYPVVEVFFIPYPIELTQFRFICPPPPTARETVTGKIDLSQMTMMMFMGKPALPQYIKFIANDQEQVMMQSPPGVKEIYYKVWVKKLPDQ